MGEDANASYPNSKIQSDVRIKMLVLKLYTAVQIEVIW